MNGRLRLVLGVAFLASPLLGQSIVIQNFDFTVSAPSEGTTVWGTPSGWDFAPSPYEPGYSGVASASDPSFVGTLTRPVGFNDYGVVGTGGDGDYLYQDLGTAFSVGATYTMTGLVGVASDQTDAAGQLLLEDTSGTMLASSAVNGPTFANSGTPASFVLESLSYTASSAEADQTLRLVLLEPFGPFGNVDFTDITLTESSVPEPRYFALWAGIFALSAIGYLRLRRAAPAC